MKLSSSSLQINPTSYEIISWVLSSAHDPLAIYQCLIYCLTVSNSAPSAILLGIETADEHI